MYVYIYICMYVRMLGRYVYTHTYPCDQNEAETWVERFGAGSSELSDEVADRLQLPRMLGLGCFGA